MKDLQAVIMAGGKGTRLQKITNNEIPKPMVRINGKPILEHQLLLLKRYGVKDITLVVGHLHEVIQAYFSDGTQWGVSIRYFIEQESLGTAGALFYCKDWLEGDFWLLFGDVMLNVSLEKMLQFHSERNAMVTLFAHPNNHPADSDIILVDEYDRVMQHYSKNEARLHDVANLVNAGLYIISNVLLEEFSAPKKLELEKDLIFPLCDGVQPIYAYRSPEYVKDMGTPQRLQQAEYDFAHGVIENKNLDYAQKCVFLYGYGSVYTHDKKFLNNSNYPDIDPTVPEALKRLNQSIYLSILLIDQSCSLQNICDMVLIDKIHANIETQLGMLGSYLDDILVCTYADCSKADTLLDIGKKKYCINLSSSWLIGNSLDQIEHGLAAGCKTILIRTCLPIGQKPTSDFVCNNLEEAISVILEDEEKKKDG